MHLYEHYGCELQVGGSDQWGNITAGIDLARRLRGVQLYGMHLPAADQERRHARWARPSRAPSGSRPRRPAPTSSTSTGSTSTTPTWAAACGSSPTWAGRRSTSLLAEHQADPGRRDAQRRLAAELTRLVHGDEGLRHGRAAPPRSSSAPRSAQLSDAQLAGIFADVPSKELPRERLSGAGLPIIDALVEAGLGKNKSEARRTITQGGAYVNNRRVEGIETQLAPADLASESIIVLRSGKKNYAWLRLAKSALLDLTRRGVRLQTWGGWLRDMKFDIRFTPNADEDLDYYQVREQRIILDALGKFLQFDADVESKRRKQLRPNPLAP